MNRRIFLAAGGATFAAAHSVRAETKSVAPLRLGLIGAGSRGQELTRHFLRIPGVSLVAACDVYAPRFEQLKTLTKAPFASFTEAQQLLERKDVDAVIVATPLYLHRKHVVAALASGRHVYGEKSMGHTVADCDAIAKAAAGSRSVFQIGHQYRYAPWYHESLRRIRSGEIGQVTHIDAYWHRNNNWRRSLPNLPSGKPNLKLDRLINWRLYREYSGGLMTELGSHAIDLANWVFGATPESVIGSGGIDYWRDGREVYDNVRAFFRYPKGQNFSFSSITSNAQQGYQQWIYGTRGSIRLTQDTATIFAERSTEAPAPQPSSHGKPKSEEPTADVVTGASYLPTGENPGGRLVAEIWRPREGYESDITYLACHAFVEHVRKNERPLADYKVGLASGVGAALANQAIDQGKLVRFADTRSLKGESAAL